MIVEVVGGADERPEARLVDVDDLGALRLALGEVTDDEATEVLERAGFGRLEDADTAVLDTAALRAAAEAQATGEGWATRWDELLASARSDGRLSEDGASLQVRVESAAGA